jgi:hypothetical protein
MGSFIPPSWAYRDRFPKGSCNYNDRHLWPSIESQFYLAFASEVGGLGLVVSVPSKKWMKC